MSTDTTTTPDTTTPATTATPTGLGAGESAAAYAPGAAPAAYQQAPGQQGAAQHQPTAAYQQAPAPVQTTPAGVFSITSLVLGLSSIVAGFTFFVPIAGLVLGVLALRREPQSRTMAIWGVVLNSVMLVGALVVTVLAVVFSLAIPFAFAGDWSELTFR